MAINMDSALPFTENCHLCFVHLCYKEEWMLLLFHFLDRFTYYVLKNMLLVSTKKQVFGFQILSCF